MSRSFLYLFLLVFTMQIGCGETNSKSQSQPTPEIRIEKFPKPAGAVSDFENLFTTEQRNYLTEMISLHRLETGNEVSIVTMLLDTLTDKSDHGFGKYSFDLFNTWGVGEKDKKNGIGILISSHLHKVRIEVGVGLEQKLTDEKAMRIIDSIMVPRFRNNEYYQGTLDALTAIASITK